MESTWTAVDDYLSERLAPNDGALEAALADSAAAGLPAISVTPTQGKLLQLLVQIRNARRILEIGTLGAYSTIWMARALPKDGTVVTLEIDDKHAAVAHKNIERAGLRGSIEIRVAPAADSLAQMKRERVDPFDLIFIDADKANIPEYFAWSLKLSRPGSLILVDNVVRGGAVIEPKSEDVSVQGVRKFFAMLAAEPRVTSTAIQTVGSKGYDGIAIALVTS